VSHVLSDDASEVLMYVSDIKDESSNHQNDSGDSDDSPSRKSPDSGKHKHNFILQ